MRACLRYSQPKVTGTHQDYVNICPESSQNGINSGYCNITEDFSGNSRNDVSSRGAQAIMTSFLQTPLVWAELNGDRI